MNEIGVKGGTETNKFAVTVWADGTWKVWGAMDAFYAQTDPDFLCNLGVQEILADVEAGGTADVHREDVKRKVAVQK